MIKRTLLFANPAYLSTEDNQLIVNYPDKEIALEKSKRLKNMPTKAIPHIPIEDIGIVILENSQITITNGLIEKLISNNVSIITCNQKHMPVSIMQPLNGHSEIGERHRKQIEASLPLKKYLWQQTVEAKIRNQALHLEENGKKAVRLHQLGKNVNSGDATNREAIAAAYYWQNIFDIEGFNRERNGIPPNNLLNYGYAILRAIIARALTGSGMLPSIGIFHKNKYNPYALADDIMEPYRPYVDWIVVKIIKNYKNYDELTTEIKKELLQIASIDVMITNKKSPLLVAVSRTTNSLYECFAGKKRKILYPIF